MKSLLVLLGLVSLSFGSGEWRTNQVKKPACCMPQTLQMGFLGTIFFDYAPAPPFQQMLSVYASKPGFAGMKYLDRKSGKLQRRVVIDYKNELAYLINSERCVKQPFKQPQSSGCLYASAKMVGEYRIGTGLDSLDGFTFQYNNPATKLKENMSVTKNCIPIHWDTTINTAKGLLVQNGGAINPSYEVTEKGIFDFPSSCKTENGPFDIATNLFPLPAFMIMDME